MILVKSLARSRRITKAYHKVGGDEQGLFIRVYLDIENNTGARNTQRYSAWRYITCV